MTSDLNNTRTVTVELSITQTKSHQ